MIRPWYRSRLFWLGVPGLAFLVWAWVSSNLRSAEVGIMGFKWQVVIESYGGAADAEFLNYGPKSPVVFDFFVDTAALESSERCWLPPAIASTNQFDDPFEENKTIHRVAYWPIVLTYAAFWLGGGAWWQRWKSRRISNQ